MMARRPEFMCHLANVNIKARGAPEIVERLEMKDSHKRAPGFFERQYICRNTKQYYNNFNVTCQYDNPISPQLLSHALKRLILDQPSFVLNFFRLGEYATVDDAIANGHNYEVRPVSCIKFADVVDFRTTDCEFDEKCLEEMNKLTIPMNENDLPLWRVIVWESHNDVQYVSFVCDHALFDGTSALQFHRDLIKLLSILSRQRMLLHMLDTLFDYEQDQALLPDVIDDALENRVDLYHRPFMHKIWLWLQRIIGARLSKWRAFVLSFFEKKVHSGPITETFAYKPGAVGLVHKYKIINFTSDECTKILSYCKSEGLTLTPYILAIATRCLERNVFPHVKPGEYGTISKISVNGRRYYLQKDQESLKYGVCVATTPISLPPLSRFSDIDLLAKISEVSAEIGRRVNNKEVFWNMGDYLKKANFWHFFASQVGQYKRDTLYTSNIGKANILDETGFWKILNVWFSQSNGLVYHFVLSVVSSIPGGLNIVLGYVPEYDDLGTAVGDFVDSFKNDMLTMNR
jgi:hypothetical protein